MDVGENTTLGNGDVTQELVQLLIVADGKLEVTGNDTGLLVVTGGVSSQLENLSSEVLENGSKVNGSTGTDTLGVVTLAEQTVDTANREGQTSLGGTAEGVDVSMKRRYRMRNVNNLRLRVLAAASLAAGLSASHFDGLFGGGRELVLVEKRRELFEGGELGLWCKVARAGGRACGSGGPL